MYVETDSNKQLAVYKNQAISYLLTNRQWQKDKALKIMNDPQRALYHTMAYKACKRCRTSDVLSTPLQKQTTEHTQMKDRFSTTEANTAIAKLRGVSLLSDELRQGEFYLPFRKYIYCTGRNLQGKIFLRERRASESEVRGRETLLEHLRTPACVHIVGKIAQFRRRSEIRFRSRRRSECSLSNLPFFLSVLRHLSP